MLGLEANQHMVSFSPVLCGLHSQEPGALTQAFKSSKGQKYSQFISRASSQGENGRTVRDGCLLPTIKNIDCVTGLLWANLY